MACCQRGRAKTFCEDGNVAMLDSSRLMAGLTLSENTCFPDRESWPPRTPDLIG